MLRIFVIVLIVIALAVVAIAARFFFSNTAFDEKSKFLYIHTGRATKEEVMKTLRGENFIDNPRSFDLLATQMDVWPSVRPGRYEVKNGTSLFNLARMLRNARQSPVNLVITKIRTKENLASLVGKKFETDSITILAFLNNTDTLRNYGLDTNTVMTAMFPGYLYIPVEYSSIRNIQKVVCAV